MVIAARHSGFGVGDLLGDHATSPRSLAGHVEVGRHVAAERHHRGVQDLAVGHLGRTPRACSTSLPQPVVCVNWRDELLRRRLVRQRDRRRRDLAAGRGLGDHVDQLEVEAAVGGRRRAPACALRRALEDRRSATPSARPWPGRDRRRRRPRGPCTSEDGGEQRTRGRDAWPWDGSAPKRVPAAGSGRVPRCLPGNDASRRPSSSPTATPWCPTSCPTGAAAALRRDQPRAVDRRHPDPLRAPGNRFYPALLRAGIIERPIDPPPA